jgi:hypothetical protein
MTHPARVRLQIGSPLALTFLPGHVEHIWRQVRSATLASQVVMIGESSDNVREPSLTKWIADDFIYKVVEAFCKSNPSLPISSGRETTSAQTSFSCA